MKIAWAGSVFISSNLSAPRYRDTKDEMALRVWPKIQMSMDKNVPTIPTAASDSVALWFTLPIIAVSVNDNTGSATPEINAGMANLLIFLKEISALKGSVHNNKMDIHSVWENKFHHVFCSTKFVKFLIALVLGK